MGKARRKIGEVAREFGLTPQALRFYEAEGLIRPTRTAKGTRLFDDEDRERLRLIGIMVRLGIPLAALRALASARAGSVTGDAASRQVDDQLAVLKSNLESWSLACAAALADIEKARAFVVQCFGCARRPTIEICGDCPVAQTNQSRIVADLVWDNRDEAPR